VLKYAQMELTQSFMRTILKSALIVVSVFTLGYLALGQQSQDHQPTRESKRKPVQPRESDEHKFARLRYEQAVESRDGLAEEWAAVVERSLEDHEAWNRYTPEEQQAVLTKLDRLKEQIRDAQALSETRAAQLQHADECASVYRATIDRKNVDLTVRQTEHIASCKALDLYPPAVR
jgi:hypothetical protein